MINGLLYNPFSAFSGHVDDKARMTSVSVS